MMHGFFRTLVKITVASLIVGAIMAHFGVTPDQLARALGLSEDRVAELARQALNWALLRPFSRLGTYVKSRCGLWSTPARQRTRSD